MVMVDSGATTEYPCFCTLEFKDFQGHFQGLQGPSYDNHANFKRHSTSSTPIVYTVSQKKLPTFKLSVTLSNVNRFSKFLHSWKAYEICYKTYMALPTSS